MNKRTLRFKGNNPASNKNGNIQRTHRIARTPNASNEKARNLRQPAAQQNPHKQSTNQLDNTQLWDQLNIAKDHLKNGNLPLANKSLTSLLSQRMSIKQKKNLNNLTNKLSIEERWQQLKNAKDHLGNGNLGPANDLITQLSSQRASLSKSQNDVLTTLQLFLAKKHLYNNNLKLANDLITQLSSQRASLSEYQNGFLTTLQLSLAKIHLYNNNLKPANDLLTQLSSQSLSTEQTETLDNLAELLHDANCERQSTWERAITNREGRINALNKARDERGAPIDPAYYNAGLFWDYCETPLQPSTPNKTERNTSVPSHANASTFRLTKPSAEIPANLTKSKSCASLTHR